MFFCYLVIGGTLSLVANQIFSPYFIHQNHVWMAFLTGAIISTGMRRWKKFINEQQITNTQ